MTASDAPFQAGPDERCDDDGGSMPARVTAERSRIALVGGAAAFALLRALRLEAGANAASLPEVTVYKSPT